MKKPCFDSGIKTGFTELWLHYLWKEKKFSTIELETDDNKCIKINQVGWYNRGWGPDFKNSKILLGDDEFFGDIEIHITESSWKKHGHHNDEAYNKVILHVFMIEDQQRAVNHLKQVVPSLNLGNKKFETFWQNNQIPTNLAVKELPGACALYLTKSKYQKIKNLIFEASEQRLITKSNQFEAEIRDQSLEDTENALFASICQSAGYSAYARQFLHLAQTYPYSEILKLFRSLHRQSRVEILGRWLGFTGILASVATVDVHDDLRREWFAFQQFYLNLKSRVTSQPKESKNPNRPLNNSLRRLTGLYYHLEKIQFQGLLKSWLSFFQDCRETLEENPKNVRIIIVLLDQMFPQPEWDPLNHLVFATSKQTNVSKLRLIGKQRQLIILVNSIIPFFLAWSKCHNDKTLEKTLFALFLLLPAENKNRKTRFMEQRLLQLNQDIKIKKNLSYHQGLIQLHDDCCKSFYQGCDNCSLIQMIR